MKFKVGDKVELKKTMLGNDAGVVGIVFYVYDGGVQIIFPNGNFDGFDKSEQENYLKYFDHVFDYATYQFKNVIQVSNDFRNGFWRFDKP